MLAHWRTYQVRLSIHPAVFNLQFLILVEKKKANKEDRSKIIIRLSDKHKGKMASFENLDMTFKCWSKPASTEWNLLTGVGRFQLKKRGH